MNIVNRAKNIIMIPREEWPIIISEKPNVEALFLKYALPLIVASAIVGFIGYTFIWRSGLSEFYFLEGTETDALVNRGLSFGFQTVFIGVFGVWLTALAINALAAKFDSEKNIEGAIELVCYSYTPIWAVGILMIYPPIGFIGSLFGLYGLYIMYLGIPQIMKTPQEKIVPYRIISIIILLTTYIGLETLFHFILWDAIINVLRHLKINAHPLK